MILTGIGDEAGAALDAQIKATLALGWRHLEMRMVEVPGFPKGNLHDIPEAAFAQVAEQLQAAGLQVYCFGSAIANWSKKISDPFDDTLAEVRRCIPRMQRLNTRLVRIMSFKPGDTEDDIPQEVFRRVGEITRMFLDAGLQPVHENCMNYGGMSWRHAERLLAACPGLQWVFDTGNPVFNPDRSQPRPWPRQDPWEFWEHLRDHVAHIHVKDAIFVPAKNDCDYTYPGEGAARVRQILQDACRRGYDAGISIEPHLAAVFHDAHATTAAGSAFESYVGYGRRLEAMLREIQAEIPAACL
ncbi:MAG TPA: TIM barrel protein [Verrucomicrobiae bacterium]|jgi:sugar phosphate isomerase/epimerase|nr:TIM barrel protein [Verrucomicrobiae bacterium]